MHPALDYINSLERNCRELRKALREESPVPQKIILKTMQRRLDTIKKLLEN